jgi:plasmid maintenance system antidote protein VapI
MKPIQADSSLRELFRQRGLSFEAVSVIAGVDTSVISRVVNGKRQARPETIVKLARALGIGARRLQAMADAAYDAEHSEDQAVSA